MTSSEFPKRPQDSLMMVGEYPLSPLLGRSEELGVLDRWFKESRKPLLILGQGGSGKSALAAHWLMDHSGLLSRAVWFSLYATSGTLADFVDAAYTNLCEPSSSSVSKIDDVIKALKAKRAVVVLDGLERALVAYHHYDLSAVDQAADDNLNFVEALGQSILLKLAQEKIPLVVTSRVKPNGIDSATFEMLDVEKLRSGDIFVGLKAAEANHWIEVADGHALTARILRGLLPVNPNFASQELDPLKRRIEIFESAWNHLSGSQQMVLARLSVFRRPLSVALVEPLFLFDADTPIEDRKAQSTQMLLELADRGFVLYARGFSVDLHPVARAFIAGKRSSTVGKDVLARVSPRSLADESLEIRSVADLAFEIELFHTMCDLGRFAQASTLYRNLSKPLVRLGIGIRDRVQLLRRFAGETLPPSPERIEELRQGGLADDSISARFNDLGSVLRLSGDRTTSDALCRWLILFDIDSGCTAFNLAVALSQLELSLPSGSPGREHHRLLELAEECLAVDGRTDHYFAAQHAWLWGNLGRSDEFGRVKSALEEGPVLASDARRLLTMGQYALALATGLGLNDGDQAMNQLCLDTRDDLINQLNLASFRAERAILAEDYEDACQQAKRAFTLCGRCGIGVNKYVELLATTLSLSGQHDEARQLIETQSPESLDACAWRAVTMAELGDNDIARSMALDVRTRAWGDGTYPFLRLVNIADRTLRRIGATAEPLTKQVTDSADSFWFEAPVAKIVAAWKLAAERREDCFQPPLHLMGFVSDSGESWYRTSLGGIFEALEIEPSFGRDEMSTALAGRRGKPTLAVIVPSALRYSNETVALAFPTMDEPYRISDGAWAIEVDRRWQELDVHFPPASSFETVGACSLAEHTPFLQWLVGRAQSDTLCLEVDLRIEGDEDAESQFFSAISEVIQKSGARQLGLKVAGDRLPARFLDVLYQCEKVEHLELAFWGRGSTEQGILVSTLIRLQPKYLALSSNLTFWNKDLLRRELPNAMIREHLM